MSDHEYIKALANAGVFYIPLSITQSSDLAASFWLIGQDLTGRFFRAEARKVRGVGSPILTMSAAITVNELRTWQSLVESGVISYVPHGVDPADDVRTTGITLSSPVLDVSAAYVASGAALGSNADLDWELVVSGPNPFTLSAGPLTITPGIV